MSVDLHSLTGAYVLDALPEDDQIRFEEHLAYCASCTTEVTQLREAATKLSASSAASPPPALKAAVMAAIAEVEQLPPLADADPTAQSPDQAPAVRARALGRRSLLALAAAAVIVAGAGGVAIDQYRDNAATRRTTDQIAGVLAQPDARTVHGTLAGGGQATIVASVSKDAAVVVLRGLPALPDGRTYQLWLIDSSKTAHSVGLASAASDTQTRVIAGGIAGQVAFGITVEPAGGSQQPTMPAAAIISMA